MTRPALALCGASQIQNSVGSTDNSGHVCLYTAPTQGLRGPLDITTGETILASEQVRTQVLILHSEQRTLDNLSSGFNDSYTVHCATSGTEALNTLTETPIHVIISALELPGMSGIEALREAKKRSPNTIGILLASRDDDDLEAVVGYKEVFQIVHGGVSAEDVVKLVDNATQQMRLLALAESANDMAANPDEPVTEHIVMETSENGSAIISDGTGTIPILDPKKISAAAAVGARTVDVLVLTKDEEFLATIRESSCGMHNIRYANTLAQAEQALAKYKIGVAVVDAAMAGPNVEKLTQHLRGKSSRLVSIVAGRRDDGEMLMDLINRGKVYRFLLKPVSPGRARLAVEASVKHHLEAPESAFKLSAGETPAAPKPQVASRLKPAAKPKPEAKPKAKAVPKPGTNTKLQAKPIEQPVEIKPSLANDRLSTAFDGDDTSFAETMTGIVSNIGEKISKRKATKKVQVDIGAAPAAKTDSSDGSPFANPKIIGIAAAAIIAVIAIGVWVYSGSSDTPPNAEPVATEVPPAITNSGTAPDTVPSTDVEAVSADVLTREEIDLAFANAEAAILDNRSADAAAELNMVISADPDNTRLPFLMAQLSQMQLREFLANARVALQESRLDDAANELFSARSLNVANTVDLEALEGDLAAAIEVQTDAERLAAESARRAEADRVAAAQAEADRVAMEKIEAERVAAAKLEADRLAAQQAEADRVAAEKVEADRVAAEKVEADRIAAEKVEAERMAAAKLEADRLAGQQAEADRFAAEQLEVERLAAEQRAAADQRQAATLAAATVPVAASSGSNTQANPQFDNPVGISSLTRTRYVAPRYPRVAERRNLSGWVDIVFTVAQDGTTKDIEIRNSEPGQTFVNAATKAVEKWEFMPIFENGIVIEKRAGVRMMFAIE